MGECRRFAQGATATHCNMVGLRGTVCPFICPLPTLTHLLAPTLLCRLNIKRDRMHILFGGTKLLQSTGDKSAKIKTPDGGCLAVVLRTGFGTAQGAWRCMLLDCLISSIDRRPASGRCGQCCPVNCTASHSVKPACTATTACTAGRLMRTILYSTERVTANNLEAFLFILFLLIWAVAASGYVLYHGLQVGGWGGMVAGQIQLIGLLLESPVQGLLGCCVG